MKAKNAGHFILISLFVFMSIVLYSLINSLEPSYVSTILAVTLAGNKGGDEETAKRLDKRENVALRFLASLTSSSRSSEPLTGVIKIIRAFDWGLLRKYTIDL
jgi:hypothetical protein